MINEQCLECDNDYATDGKQPKIDVRLEIEV